VSEARRTADEDLPLPDFVIVGAQRAATRWLRANLGDHPDIHLPGAPVDHFSHPSEDRGVRAYRMAFRHAGGARFVGEASPSYLLPMHRPRAVARRINHLLPESRVIAILRDPVDRMCSAFRDHVIHGRLPLDADLADLVKRDHPDVERLGLVGGGLYSKLLTPYRKAFGDRLLIVFHDDVRDDPAKVYDAVLAHIGAPVGFVPRRLDWVLYSNAASKWGRAAAITPEQRRVLYMLFRRDVEELEAMTGRYLPAWDPGPPPLDWADHLPPPP
jgi:hypothetical protein